MIDLELFRRARYDREAKDKIVMENEGLVWSVARRFLGRGYELEDLFQIGCIGLLKAIDRFDESYNVMFSTYAVPLIMGEIKRFIRDNGMVKVSRILKQNGYRISKAKEELTAELGRDASLFDIAEKTGLSVEDIVMATEANFDVLSIDQPVAGDKTGGTNGELSLLECVEAGGKEQRIEEQAMNSVMLSGAFERLDEKKQALIRLRYFEERTQMEVAASLGMSQVQVSRLEKKVLKEMRDFIDNKSN